MFYIAVAFMSDRCRLFITSRMRETVDDIVRDSATRSGVSQSCGLRCIAHICSRSAMIISCLHALCSCLLRLVMERRRLVQ